MQWWYDHTCFLVQANVNEIMAGSVVYMGQVPVDRPCTSWNNSRHLRHFSVLRKMDNQPFPTGLPAYLYTLTCWKSLSTMPFSCMTFLTRAGTYIQEVFLTCIGGGLSACVTIQAVSHISPARCLCIAALGTYTSCMDISLNICPQTGSFDNRCTPAHF